MVQDTGLGTEVFRALNQQDQLLMYGREDDPSLETAVSLGQKSVYPRQEADMRQFAVIEQYRLQQFDGATFLLCCDGAGRDAMGQAGKTRCWLCV